MPPTASDDEIHDAYRARARELHPDVAGDDPERAREMQRVNEAWSVLGDPDARRAYDGGLASRGPAAPVLPEEVEPPPGFSLYDPSYVASRIHGPGWEAVSHWAYRVGDGTRRALSLAADSEDLSGLRELGDTELWKLSLARLGIVDSDLELLRRFRRLEWLDLNATMVTDAGLQHLTRLGELRELILTRCPITDAGIATLRAMESLQELVLFGTKITDDGAGALAFHPNLSVLDLRDTKVKEACLPSLVTIPKLRELRLPRAAKRDSSRFKQMRPDVSVL